MRLQTWQVAVVFIGGGLFVFLLASVVVLINDLRKAACRFEEAAATFDAILKQELKALLVRGEKALYTLQNMLPLIEQRISEARGDDIFSLIGTIAGRRQGNMLSRIVVRALSGSGKSGRKGGALFRALQMMFLGAQFSLEEVIEWVLGAQNIDGVR